jgi:hypothetical protein
LKKPTLITIGIAAIILLSIAAMASPVNALTNDIAWHGKGAVAVWDIPNNNRGGSTIVYAVLSESNEGNNGQLYIRMVHTFSTGTPRISEGVATNVDFQWNMNHITVKVIDMVFTGGYAGKHTMEITMLAMPKSQGQAPSTIESGLAIDLDGSWKAANALMWIDGNTGAHNDKGTPFASDSAYIIHGNAKVTLP